jgi:ABC-2 type transport system ATP-binding protein
VRRAVDFSQVAYYIAQLTMTAPIIAAERISKSYGSIVALQNISLAVEAGTIFGLLGPNGAGKTTLVKILTTLTSPDGGAAQVADLDVARQPAQVRAVIGYVPQEITVDPYLTPLEHLHFYASLYHLPAAVRDARIDELVSLVGLQPHRDRVARHFSGGMKKKLDLACGLLHRPRLVFLDEPSLGLDVRARQELWSYILRLKSEGTTVFVCTNYMDEADRLCDEIAIIDRGRVVARGAPETLKGQLKKNVISLEMPATGEERADSLAALERAIVDLGIAAETLRSGRRLKIYVDGDRAALPKVLEEAARLTIPLESVTYSRPGLDEVFLHHTGRALVEGGE